MGRADASRLDRDRESRKLHFNDRIVFYDTTNEGFLANLGQQTRAVGVHFPCVNGKRGNLARRSSCNPKFRDYLFEVLPYDMSVFNPHRRREIEAIRGEVCYGERVILRHVVTQGFLSVPSVESPASSSWPGENDNLQLTLVRRDSYVGPHTHLADRDRADASQPKKKTGPGPETCFRIVPSFKVRQEGQPVEAEDEVLLEHVELRPMYYVHTAGFRKLQGAQRRTALEIVHGSVPQRIKGDTGDWTEDWTESNLSLRDTSTTFAIKLFEMNNRDPEGAWVRNMTAAELTQRYQRRDRLLKVGDPLLLYHQDHEGYLTAKKPIRCAGQGRSAADFTMHKVDCIAEKMKCFSRNSFFSFELQDTSRGGLIALDRPVRIRHIPSGLYLAHFKPPSTADGDEGGRAELRLVDLDAEDAEAIDSEGCGLGTLWMPHDRVYGEDARHVGVFEESLPAAPEARMRNDKAYRFAGIALPAPASLESRFDRPFDVRCWLGTRGRDGKVEMCAERRQRFQDSVVVMHSPDRSVVHELAGVTMTRPVMRQWQEYWRHRDEEAARILQQGSDPETKQKELEMLQSTTPPAGLVERLFYNMGRLVMFLSPPDLKVMQEERRVRAVARGKDLLGLDSVERHRLHKQIMLEQDIHLEVLECIRCALEGPNWGTDAMAAPEDILTPRERRRSSTADAADRLRSPTAASTPGRRSPAPDEDWTGIVWRGVPGSSKEREARGGLRGFFTDTEEVTMKKLKHDNCPVPGRFDYNCFHARGPLEGDVAHLQSALVRLYSVLRHMVKEYEPAAISIAELRDGQYLELMRRHVVWHRVQSDLCLAEMLKHQRVVASNFLRDDFFKRIVVDLRTLSQIGHESSRRLAWQGERDGHCVAERLVQLLAMCCVCESTGEAVGRNQRLVHEFFLERVQEGSRARQQALWPNGRLLMSHRVASSQRVNIKIAEDMLTHDCKPQLWICKAAKAGRAAGSNPLSQLLDKGMDLSLFCEHASTPGNAPLMAYHVACTELFAALCKGRSEVEEREGGYEDSDGDPVVKSISHFYGSESMANRRHCLVEAMKEAQQACLGGHAGGSRDGKGAAVCPAYAALVRDWFFSEPKEEGNRLVCLVDRAPHSGRILLKEWAAGHGGAGGARDRHKDSRAPPHYITAIKDWVARICRELASLQQNNATGVKMVAAALTLCRQLVTHGFYTEGGQYRALTPPLNKKADRRTDEGLAVSLLSVLNPQTDGVLSRTGGGARGTGQGSHKTLSEDERRHYCDENLPLFRIKLEVCGILHALLDDKLVAVYLPAILGLEPRQGKFDEWRTENMPFWQNAGGTCRSFFPKDGVDARAGDESDPRRRGFGRRPDLPSGSAELFFADLVERADGPKRSRDLQMLCRWLGGDDREQHPFNLSGDAHLFSDTGADGGEDAFDASTKLVRHLLEMALYQWEPLVGSALRLLFRTAAVPLEVCNALNEVVLLEESPGGSTTMQAVYKNMLHYATVLANKLNDVWLRGQPGVCEDALAPTRDARLREQEVFEMAEKALVAITDMCIPPAGEGERERQWAARLQRGVPNLHCQRLLACTGTVPRVLSLIDDYLFKESDYHPKQWWLPREKNMLQAAYRLLTALVKDNPEAAADGNLLGWVCQRAKDRLRLHWSAERSPDFAEPDQERDPERLLLDWDLTNFLLQLSSHRSVAAHLSEHKDVVWAMVKQLAPPSGGQLTERARHLRLLRQLSCVVDRSQVKPPSFHEGPLVCVTGHLKQPGPRGLSEALGIHMDKATVISVLDGGAADIAGVRRGMTFHHADGNGIQVDATGLRSLDGECSCFFRVYEDTTTVLEVYDEVIESTLATVINYIVAEKRRVLMLLRDSQQREREARSAMLGKEHQRWLHLVQEGDWGECSLLPADQDGELQYHIELVSLFAKALRGNTAVLTYEFAFDVLWPAKNSGPFPLYFARPYCQLLAEYLARDDKQELVLGYVRKQQPGAHADIWNVLGVCLVVLHAVAAKRWDSVHAPCPYSQPNDSFSHGAVYAAEREAAGGSWAVTVKQVARVIGHLGVRPPNWEAVSPLWYSRAELEQFVVDGALPLLAAAHQACWRHRAAAGAQQPKRAKLLRSCVAKVCSWSASEHFRELRPPQQAAVLQFLTQRAELQDEPGRGGEPCLAEGCSGAQEPATPVDGAPPLGLCLAHQLSRARVTATHALVSDAHSGDQRGDNFAAAMRKFQLEFRAMVHCPWLYKDVPHHPSQSLRRAAEHVARFHEEDEGSPDGAPRPTGSRLTPAILLAYAKRRKRLDTQSASGPSFKDTYLLRQVITSSADDTGGAQKRDPQVSMLGQEYFSTFVDVLVSPYLPKEHTADVLGVLAHSFAEPERVKVLEKHLAQSKDIKLHNDAKEALAKVDERKKEFQAIFCQKDAVQCLLTLMEERAESRTQTNAIHAEALNVLVCLLEGGERLRVQRAIHDFFCDRTTEGFFCFCRVEIKAFQDEIKDLDPEMVRVDTDECYSIMQSLAHMETLLRVLQLFCEGHYEQLQNYLRSQEDNSFSVNVVKEVATFTGFLTKTKNGELVSFAPHLLDQAFKTLTEFCQGPCRYNQEVLVETKIPALVGTLLDNLAAVERQSQEDDDWDRQPRDEDDSQLTSNDQVLSSAIGTLLSLTEGVGSSSGEDAELRVDVPKQLLDMLRDQNPKTGMTNLAHLLQRMNDSWIKGAVCRHNSMDSWVWNHRGASARKELEEDEEAQLELGYNIFIFLLSLCRFDKQRAHALHRDEVAESPLKTDLRHQMSFSFFNERVAQIEIRARDRSTIEKVYFKKPRQTALLQEETKQKVNVQVKRDSRETKIQDFFSRWHDLVEEIIIYNQRNNSIWSNFIRWGEHLEYVSLAMSLVISVYLMMLMKRVNDPQTEYLSRRAYNVFLVLAILQITLEMLMLVGWLQIKGRVITQKFVKEAQRETANAQKTGTDASKWQAYVDWSKKPAFSQFYLGLYILANHREFYVVCLFAASAWAGLFGTPIFFSVQIFRIIQRSDSLQNVIRSVTEKWGDLLWTMSLGIVAIYLFSMVSFYFYSDKYYDVKRNPDLGMGFTCQELSRCFLLNLVYGLRQGGGLADVLQHPDWHGGKNYVLRLIFDFLFWVVMIIIFLNIIFGIILDTFAELRDRKQDRERDQKTKCFICGQDAYEFDKSRFSSFDEHYHKDHNMWDYLYFFLHLRLRNSDEYTGQESYVKQRIDRNLTDFFPENAIVLLEDADDSDKEEELREKQIESKVTRLLSLVQQQESRHRPGSLDAGGGGGGPGGPGGPASLMSFRSPRAGSPTRWFSDGSPRSRGDRGSVGSLARMVTDAPAESGRMDDVAAQVKACDQQIAELRQKLQQAEQQAAEAQRRDAQRDELMRQLLDTAREARNAARERPRGRSTPPTPPPSAVPSDLAAAAAASASASPQPQQQQQQQQEQQQAPHRRPSTGSERRTPTGARHGELSPPTSHSVQHMSVHPPGRLSPVPLAHELPGDGGGGAWIQPQPRTHRGSPAPPRRSPPRPPESRSPGHPLHPPEPFYAPGGLMPAAPPRSVPAPAPAAGCLLPQRPPPPRDLPGAMERGSPYGDGASGDSDPDFGHGADAESIPFGHATAAAPPPGGRAGGLWSSPGAGSAWRRPHPGEGGRRGTAGSAGLMWGDDGTASPSPPRRPSQRAPPAALQQIRAQQWGDLT